MKNIFEVLRIAKQNDGRIGKDAILDENRHITFYEDYANGQTRSVSIPIDNVKIDEFNSNNVSIYSIEVYHKKYVSI